MNDDRGAQYTDERIAEMSLAELQAASDTLLAETQDIQAQLGGVNAPAGRIPDAEYAGYVEWKRRAKWALTKKLATRAKITTRLKAVKSACRRDHSEAVIALSRALVHKIADQYSFPDDQSGIADTLLNLVNVLYAGEPEVRADLTERIASWSHR